MRTFEQLVAVGLLVMRMSGGCGFDSTGHGGLYDHDCPIDTPDDWQAKGLLLNHNDPTTCAIAVYKESGEIQTTSGSVIDQDYSPFNPDPPEDANEFDVWVENNEGTILISQSWSFFYSEITESLKAEVID